MENPIKMDDLGVSLFLETSICAKNTFPMSQQNVFVMGLSAANKKVALLSR